MKKLNTLERLEHLVGILRESVSSCEVIKNENGELEKISIKYDGSIKYGDDEKDEWNAVGHFMASLKYLGQLKKEGTGLSFLCSWCGVHNYNNYYLYPKNQKNPIKISYDALKNCYCPD